MWPDQHVYVLNLTGCMQVLREDLAAVSLSAWCVQRRLWELAMVGARARRSVSDICPCAIQFTFAKVSGLLWRRVCARLSAYTRLLQVPAHARRERT